MSEEHHDHSKHYIKLYWILLALFVVSCLGPEIGIKAVTLITAFGIAGVKAYIVIAHFMHLKGEKQFVIYLLTASVGLMFLFYFAVAPDVHNHEGRNWVNTSAMASVTDGFCTAFDDCSHHAKEGDEACAHGGFEGDNAAREAHIEAQHAEHESHGEAAHGEAHGHDHGTEAAPTEGHGDEATGEEAAGEEAGSEEAHGHDHSPSDEAAGEEGAGH